MKWISIEDKLPEKSGEVLTLWVDKNGCGWTQVVQYSAKHKAFNASDVCDNADHALPVNYWMPLPKGPKGVRIYGA